MVSDPPGTARLALRRFAADDVDALIALDSDPRVMHFINGGMPTSREAAQTAIERIIGLYAGNGGLGVWHVSRRDDGGFIGWVSLKHPGESPDIEIGYRLAHSAWGQGFATELARAMLARGFGDLGLERIVGVTDDGNVASQRVLLKIGMHDEGWGHYYGERLRLFAAYRAPPS